MIDSRIYIKSLNATEAGESNTNDSYILIPKMFNASDFFGLSSGNKLHFEAVDPETGTKYNLRYEVTSNTKEQRIYMLGIFCRAKNLHAGDTISIEKLTLNNSTSFIIRYRQQKKIVLLQKIKGDYLIERNDIGDTLFNQTFHFTRNGEQVDFSLSYKYHGKKRNDSPDEYDFYEVLLVSGQKLSDISKDQYVILDFNKNAIVPFEKATEYRITQN